MQASVTAASIRLAHFSDVHLSAPRCGWKPRDWFNKRLTSWLNHRFSRAARFALAEEIVTRLMDELPRRAIDHAVFSGDATALGFEAEIRRAAQMLRVEQPMRALAIPGNHDYCTRSAAASGHFERYFAPWQQGRRIGEHRYPFAQQAGPVWLIAVNAATGNRLPWDAGGCVDVTQLNRLQRLLDSLGPGIKILVLHFPICLSNGRREPFYHGLRDLDRLVQVARAGGVKLWLHGHRHLPYYLERPGAAPFPVICAGTATQRGIWSYGEYTIDGSVLRAVRRAYQPTARCFVDVETFSLQLS
jgi:3',5'-cyclic AMP phosphodiesterase CpdA